MLKVEIFVDFAFIFEIILLAALKFKLVTTGRLSVQNFARISVFCDKISRIRSLQLRHNFSLLDVIHHP
jgi:hypothetical protein